MSIDIYPVIAAANTQPFSHIHQPGVGVGGHCIPVYPYFLANRAPKTEMRLPRLSREINDGMAGYAVRKLEAELDGLAGKTVLVLGLAYRGDVKEAAFSSAFKLVEALQAAGATALVHDPLYSAEEIAGYGLTPATLNPPPAAEGVILQATHQQYKDFDWNSIPGCQAVLDGRNALQHGSLPTPLTLLWVGR